MEKIFDGKGCGRYYKVYLEKEKRFNEKTCGESGYCPACERKKEDVLNGQ